MDESKNHKVYVLQAPDGRVYIGMTGQSISSRCRKSCYIGCPLMEKAIADFG